MEGIKVQKSETRGNGHCVTSDVDPRDEMRFEAESGKMRKTNICRASARVGKGKR